MSARAYTLRPEYKDKLVGGSVISGADYGTMHLLEELEKGNGELITEDPFLQGSLEQVYGAEGLLFDVAEVVGDKRRPISPIAAPRPGDFGPPPPLEASVEIGQDITSVPAAQHGELSDYAQLTKDEIKTTLDERHVPYTNSATKEELIAVLERSDTEGVSSGS